ncbi:MAG: DMT family transporter [Pseudomonadota bacterium]
MSLRHWICVVILGFAFGTSFAFNEVLLTYSGPLTVSAGRVLMAAIGCWIWVYGSGRAVHVPRRDIPRIALFGVFQFAAPFAFLPLAQQQITSSAAGIANAMTPLAVVIVSHFWSGGDRATPRTLSGVLLGLVGIVVLTSGVSITEGSDPKYVGIALLAPLCYALALNTIRTLKCKDPFVSVTWALTLGALAICPLAILIEGSPGALPLRVLALYTLFGFVFTAAAFVWMHQLRPVVGATNISLVTFIAPLSALGIGSVALGEQIGMHHMGGATLILTGLLVLDGRLIRFRHRTTPGTSRMTRAERYQPD